MTRHVFTVLTNPVPGREDEYNKWYNDVHLPDLFKVPGVVAAQRFRLSDAQSPQAPKSEHEYLCIYEIESDDLAKTIATLESRVPDMEITSAIDKDSADFHFFTPIIPRRTAS